MAETKELSAEETQAPCVLSICPHLPRAPHSGADHCLQGVLS